MNPRLPRFLSAAMLAAAALALATVEVALAERKPAADDQTGVRVGEKAPSFRLKDQNGAEQSLDELLKKGKVALYFHRSAEWCPFCKKQLAQLQKDLAQIEAAGAQVVAISYDSVEVLKRFSDQAKVTYLMLSDPGSKTIDAYGIRNSSSKPGTRYDGIPYPGTYIIDQSGVVRAKFFLDGYVERPDNSEVAKAAKEIK